MVRRLHGGSRILRELCESDLRCLDAHVHLGLRIRQRHAAADRAQVSVVFGGPENSQVGVTRSKTGFMGHVLI